MIDTELRDQLRALTVPADDALADEMSAVAAARRPVRWVLPVAAAASVVAVTGIAAALVTGGHDPAPAGTSPSLTPASDVSSPAPTDATEPDEIVVRCTSPDGHVSYSTVSSLEHRWGVRKNEGRWALVYLPQADGSICTTVGK